MSEEYSEIDKSIVKLLLENTLVAVEIDAWLWIRDNSEKIRNFYGNEFPRAFFDFYLLDNVRERKDVVNFLRKFIADGGRENFLGDYVKKTKEIIQFKEIIKVLLAVFLERGDIEQLSYDYYIEELKQYSVNKNIKKNHTSLTRYDFFIKIFIFAKTLARSSSDFSKGLITTRMSELNSQTQLKLDEILKYVENKQVELLKSREVKARQIQEKVGIVPSALEKSFADRGDDEQQFLTLMRRHVKAKGRTSPLSLQIREQEDNQGEHKNRLDFNIPPSPVPPSPVPPSPVPPPPPIERYMQRDRVGRSDLRQVSASSASSDVMAPLLSDRGPLDDDCACDPCPCTSFMFGGRKKSLFKKSLFKKKRTKRKRKRTKRRKRRKKKNKNRKTRRKTKSKTRKRSGRMRRGNYTQSSPLPRQVRKAFRNR